MGLQFFRGKELRKFPQDAGVALGLLALLAATAWALWPGIHGPFLFDDEPNLKNLADLNGQFDRHNIGVYLSLFNGVPGRPLAALSFLINDFSWPSAPLGFKLTNLWIHLLNGVLVFGLARTLAVAHANDRPDGLRHANRAALTCAAIWLVSPIQISAVFLTVQRMAELAGTFMFAGLWAYAAIVSRARTIFHALAALAALGAATILALLCKENGILTPLLAMILHLTLIRGTLAVRPARVSRTLSVGITGTVVLLVAAFAWKWAALTSFASRDYTMWERVMTQARVLFDYAGAITLPRLAGSALYNDDFVISRGLATPPTTVAALGAVLAIFAAAVLLRKRKPLFSFGVLWFLGAHVLESTVFPLEMYFEHRNYVPLFGPALAVAIGVGRVRGDLRRPAIAGLGIWLLLATGILHQQAKVWGDEALLATIWHAEHPKSLRAQQQYASYLFAAGHPQEARAVLAAAAERGISPVTANLQNLTVACDAHEAIRSEDIAHATALLRSEPLTPGIAMILARLRLAVQQGDCVTAIPPETWLRMTQAVLDNPKGNGIWRMLLVERAELFLALGDLNRAIHELDVAYGDHRDPRIAFYAAALLATAGRYDEARSWAEKPMGRPWSWKRWLAQTDWQAHEIIKAIDQSQRAASSVPHARPQVTK